MEWSGVGWGGVGWGGDPPGDEGATSSFHLNSGDRSEQSATELLIGSQEDEPAHADEGHPRHGARKQTEGEEEEEGSI